VAKDRIEARCLDQIHQVLAEVTGVPHEVVLVVDPADESAPDEPAPAAATPAVPEDEVEDRFVVPGAVPATPRAGADSPTDSPLNPKFTFEDFAIGDSNRFA